MKRLPVMAWFAATAVLLFSPEAKAQNRATYEKLVAVHARANQVPEALVHRVIVRESKYHPDLIGHGGTIGLMQIKLATARGVGYQGDAEGLRDPETNLTYGVKYLAGAWRAAEGDHDRAVRLYAAGYYEVAKRQRLERLKHPEPVLASATEPAKTEPAKTEPAKAEPVTQAVAAPTPAAAPKEAALDAAASVEAEPEQVEKPKPALKPSVAVGRPKQEANSGIRTGANTTHAAKPKPLPGPLVLTPILARLKAALTPKPAPKAGQKKLADARLGVPRPSTGMAATPSDGANATKPR
jgi:hypothetical protein